MRLWSDMTVCCMKLPTHPKIENFACHNPIFELKEHLDILPYFTGECIFLRFFSKGAFIDLGSLCSISDVALGRVGEAS
jgi:hypothetical protein